MCAEGRKPLRYTLPMSSREIALDNEVLRVEVGSTLHGTGIAGQEDRDEMGICVPPPDYLLGMRQFEHYTYRTAGEGNRSGPGDLDLTIYSLRKYVTLASQGNPSILLTLFVPEDKVIKNTLVGSTLMENANLFHSKRAAARYLGYIQSQRNGLTGERKSGIPKRPELIEKYGFDTKYAMHAVRLGFQGIEFLKHGTITLPMAFDSGSICRDIRHGKYKLEEVLEAVDELELELKKLRDDPDIPDEPNYDSINQFLVEAHYWWWNQNR